LVSLTWERRPGCGPATKAVSNAFWIILIDALAGRTFLLAGRSFSNLFELVGILMLPGILTGVGWWLLLNQPRTRWLSQPPEILSKENTRKIPRFAWIGLGSTAAIPLFFACIRVYAVSQLALAKNGGVYPTVEEAIVANNSQGWGGAKVIRIEDIHASPNRQDGS
jgi:ABC-type Fe3+ transport system permease subunit